MSFPCVSGALLIRAIAIAKGALFDVWLFPRRSYIQVRFSGGQGGRINDVFLGVPVIIDLFLQDHFKALDSVITKKIHVGNIHLLSLNTMALINISAVRKKTITTLMKSSPPEGVVLFSYKRNRSIAIIRQDDLTFLIKERGYIEQEVVSSTDGLPRLLKEMIKREFPRSRKVRLVKFVDPAELEKPRQKI